jgi:hypothetical protein
MTLFEKIVNGKTGEEQLIPLTAEEIAERNQPYVPTQKQQKANRASAYRSEADPLFFKAQRGEATTDEWTAKVAEIKARFPYPEEANQ